MYDAVGTHIMNKQRFDRFFDSSVTKFFCHSVSQLNEFGAHIRLNNRSQAGEGCGMESFFFSHFFFFLYSSFNTFDRVTETQSKTLWNPCPRAKNN